MSKSKSSRASVKKTVKKKVVKKAAKKKTAVKKTVASKAKAGGKTKAAPKVTKKTAAKKVSGKKAPGKKVLKKTSKSAAKKRVRAAVAAKSKSARKPEPVAPPKPKREPEVLETPTVDQIERPITTPPIDEASARQTLVELLSLRGGSGDESAVAERIVERLREVGLPDDALDVDGVHEPHRIGFGSQGNLIVRLPGRGALQRTKRRLFSAHMDTVPLCVGAMPVIENDWVRGRDMDKALGGDDRSGCAVLLYTARALLEGDMDHPPVTFLWTVQEEVGLRGARYLDVSKLARPHLCFNFDGGDPARPVIGAVGDVQLDAYITGIASHAGAHPEGGASAAVVFAKALSELVAEGWHGDIQQGNRSGTANVGVLSGGSATNVVMDELAVQAEARAHNAAFRDRIARTWRKAFEDAAKSTRNDRGDSATVEWQEFVKYDSFELSESDAVVKEAVAAVEAAGLEPKTRISDGGLDANWLTAHGLPSVTIGCGQHGIHTTSERLHLPSFYAACRISMQLATGGNTDS